MVNLLLQILILDYVSDGKTVMRAFAYHFRYFLRDYPKVINKVSNHTNGSIAYFLNVGFILLYCCLDMASFVTSCFTKSGCPS